MERLTIKEVAPYLPYNVGVEITRHVYPRRTVITILDISKLEYCESQIYSLKPLLRPLSQLTEEIEHNGERFVPIIELFKLRTQVTGDKIADYYIDNNTAILRLEAQHLDEYEFRAFFEIDLEPNEVMFSIATETWKDEVMIREDVNLCGNEMTMFEKLHEWHFDTANLLGRSLALPIDGKEVENGLR